MAEKVYISANGGALDSDPELELGGVVWMERSDGRSVWRQQFKCVKIERWKFDWTHRSYRRRPSKTYVLEPVHA